MPGAPGRKQELRQQARAQPAPRAPAGDESPCARVLALLGPGEGEGRWIALYAALPGEIPLESLLGPLRERGWRTAFPRVEADGLALYEATDVAQLAPGYRGILEPPPAGPPIEPERISVFVIPALLLGRDGSRLGRGGGFYDRLLARARPEALRIGVCYSDRVRPRLPVDPWDEPVDVIVTERELLRPRRGAAEVR
jgi:5-formyltetrahydrofolate cyclo-ligase